MKKILITALLLTLTACQQDSNLNVTGGADLTVKDNLTECRIRQNGTTIFVQQDGGLDPYTIALDPSVVYLNKWVNLTDADADRINPLTQTEKDIIAGNL